ncbi:MAG: hypothetical protein XXXJIFNMEKO3_00757 [Candidatus Erwinia impunctatus]|nr:hypothetical protein XXXJIFNMEKO_00757 [Culicoides impunctatus]
MAGFVYVIGTADTKCKELLWLKSCLQAAEVDAYIIDVSTLIPTPYCDDSQIDFSSSQVAAYHPDGPDSVFLSERNQSVSAMSVALSHFLHNTSEDIAGLIGIGGSCGTALIAAALKPIPIGVPKLMVSTMASGNVASYVGGMDIAMLNTVTDLTGLNYLSRTILANAANMMAGAVTFKGQHNPAQKTVLGLTMFGVTTPCVNQLIARLEDEYDPLVFHATGNGGMSMEKLINDGEIIGALDITLTEIADYLFGGELACDGTRLDCISHTGIPWVGSSGGLDMINFTDRQSVPEHYRDRPFVKHNDQVMLVRTSPEENYQLGVWIGEKLNRCTGQIYFIIPEGGFSALDAPGKPFFHPEATQAFVYGLMTTVRQTAQRQIIKTPYHINAPEFAALAYKAFNTIMQHQGQTFESLS